MTDALPERVWLTPGLHGDGQWYGAENTITELGCYVPESRALAAEAEVERLKGYNAELQSAAGLADLVIARLTAERDALVPLALLGLDTLRYLHMDSHQPPDSNPEMSDGDIIVGHLERRVEALKIADYLTMTDTPATTAARAVLDRMKEGA